MRTGIRQPQLPLFIGLMAWVVMLGLMATASWRLRLTPASPLVVPAEINPEVLGSRTGYNEPRIYVSNEKWGSNGGVISLTNLDEPSVQISSYNLRGEVTVDIYRAQPATLLAYLTVDGEGKQKSPRVDPTGLPLIGSLKHTLTNENSDKSLLLPIENTGIWLLKIGNDQVKTDAFVVRSNTGVLTKEGNNEFIFWAQDFNTRRSAGGGKLTLYSMTDQATAITTVAFNDSGIATAPLTSEADIGWYERGEDVALLPINLQYLNTNYSYRQFRPKQRQVKYFVFTDRPLYKPGDTVYFKAVIRDDDDARYTLPGGSAKVEIFRGYGEEREVIYSSDLPVSGYGAIDGQVTLPATTPTDYYSVTVNAGEPERNPDDWWYSPGGSTSFQVQYYRKPDYYLTVASNQDEYIAGDTISYTISGNYFFGQPLTNKQVTYQVSATNYYDYSYRQDKDYIFKSDYHYGGWYGREIDSGTVDLDDKGMAHITVPAQQLEGKSAVYSLTVKLADETGTADEAVKNVLVYSGEFGIYRSDYHWGYQMNEPVAVNLVALSRSDNPVINQKLTIKGKRLWWERLPLKVGEKYYQYEKREELLPDQSVTTDSEGKTAIQFTPTAGGSYEFVVAGTDKRNNQVSQTFTLWVNNQAQPMTYGVSEGELQLKLDAEKTKPGETVEALLLSDIPDRDVFLSLERGRVSRYQIVSLNGQTATISLSIQDEDMPNIFIEGSSFSDDWLDISQVNLPVVTVSRKLNVRLTPDKQQYGPGDTVTVMVETRDGNDKPLATELALWAVDKALFELVEQSNLDIFSAFWNERWNGTEQTHSLRGIIAQMAEGGGCFAAGTRVLMGNGDEKAIEAIKAGEMVLTRKSITDESLVAGKVVGTHATTVDGYYLINKKLKVTSNHKLWVNGWWQEASTITVGDRLMGENGRPLPVETISWQAGDMTVYNLSVEKYRTFFAEGVWAHNKGEARQIFKDTAYWNPKVVTDDSGKAQVRFKLPDNLTTWTVAAVGASTTTVVGNVKKDIVVSKEVIVRPSLPNLMRLGDTVALTAMVHNYTDSDQVFTTALTFDAGRVENATVSGITVPAGGAKEVAWRVIPETEKQQAKITIRAASSTQPKVQDTIISQLPVIPFGFAEDTAATATGAHTYPISLASDADLDRTSVTLQLASTLAGTLPTAMKYLIGYPYGCVEQTTSHLVPIIIATENKALFAEALADHDIKEMVEKGMQRLKTLQQSSGGWGWWWPENSPADPFVTTYVSEYLVRAQKANLVVDPTLIENAKRFFAEATYQTNGGTQRQMFTGDAEVAKKYAWLYLEPDKKVEPIPLERLKNVSLDYLPWAIQVNLAANIHTAAINGVDLLWSKAQQQGDAIYWEAGSKQHYGSNDATTALALTALLHADYDREKLASVARYLMRSRQKNYWSNTFATAQVTNALTAFAQSGAENAPHYTYTVTLDGTELGRGAVVNSGQRLKDIVIPVKSLKNNTGNLVITYEGDGQLYSTLLTKTFHTDRQAPPVSNGMRVRREYTSDKGVGYSLALGDTVTVRLIIDGLKEGESYGVIQDELPAGLAPINPLFKNEQSEGAGSYFWRRGVNGYDITQNGIVISLNDILSEQENIYTYKARVINAGTYIVPPVTAHLMYLPEVNARSGAETVTIDSEAKFDPVAAARAGKDTQLKSFGTRPWWHYALLGSALLIGLGALGYGGYTLWRKKKIAKTQLPEPPTPAPPVTPPSPPPQPPGPDKPAV